MYFNCAHKVYLQYSNNIVVKIADKLSQQDMKGLHIISNHFKPLNQIYLRRWFNCQHNSHVPTDLSKRYLPKLGPFWDDIMRYLVQSQHHDSTCNYIKLLKMEIINGDDLQIGRLRNFQTRYFNYTDSHVESGDFIWGVENDQHFCYYVDSIWQITGLNTWKYCNILQPFVNVTDVILICGFNVVNIDETKFVSMENYDITDMVEFKINWQSPKITSATNIIQKLYAAHSHCLMTLDDHIKLSNSIDTSSKWPFLQPSNISRLGKSNSKSGIYCGWYPTYDQHQKCMKLDAQCCHEENPVFTLYSVYQGFIPRLFSTKTISEL